MHVEEHLLGWEKVIHEQGPRSCFRAVWNHSAHAAMIPLHLASKAPETRQCRLSELIPTVIASN